MANYKLIYARDYKENFRYLPVDIMGNKNKEFSLEEIDLYTSSFSNQEDLIKEYNKNCDKKDKIIKRMGYSFFIVYEYRGTRSKNIIYNAPLITQVSYDVISKKKKGMKSNDIKIDFNDEVIEYINKFREFISTNKVSFFRYFNSTFSDLLTKYRNYFDKNFDHSDEMDSINRDFLYTKQNISSELKNYRNFRDAYLCGQDNDLVPRQKLVIKEKKSITFEELYENTRMKSWINHQIPSDNGQMNLFDLVKNENTDNENKSSSNFNYTTGEQVTLDGYFGDNTKSKKI